MYGLVSRSARTNRQTPTNKQTATRENWRSNSTMNPLRFHQSTNRRRKKLFQEQIVSRTKPWRGYYGYDGCAGWECCDWIRWQHNTRQPIVDALHDGPTRRTPQRQSIIDALDERPSQRTPRSSRTPPCRLLDAHHGPRKLRNRP